MADESVEAAAVVSSASGTTADDESGAAAAAAVTTSSVSAKAGVSSSSKDHHPPGELSPEECYVLLEYITKRFEGITADDYSKVPLLERGAAIPGLDPYWTATPERYRSTREQIGKTIRRMYLEEDRGGVASMMEHWNISERAATVILNKVAIKYNYPRKMSESEKRAMLEYIARRFSGKPVSDMKKQPLIERCVLIPGVEPDRTLRLERCIHADYTIKRHICEKYLFELKADEEDEVAATALARDLGITEEAAMVVLNKCKSILPKKKYHLEL